MKIRTISPFEVFFAYHKKEEQFCGHGEQSLLLLTRFGKIVKFSPIYCRLMKNGGFC